MRLIRIGYWKGPESPGYPDPSEWIDEAWDDRERQVIADYLRDGQLAWVACGLSTCRLCGKPNGSGERTDGNYVWPEGLAHYLEEHGVRLPREFEEHVAQKLAALDGAEIDEQWWVSLSSR